MTMVVAAHKPYWIPEDNCYLPVQAGAVGKPSIPGFQRDDEGDNISLKNPNYCELTALYWAWKNLDSDWLGLAHYRRHFGIGSHRISTKTSRVATGLFLEGALSESDILMPKARNYYIETNYSQYIHAHHEEDLEITRDVLSRRDSKAVECYDSIMNRTYGHRFNMFVMRRTLADEWCEWLFSILGDVEARLDISHYSKNDARVYGFIAERLIDVWVESNRLVYLELPVVNLESQHWGKKGLAFLQRKFS